MEFKNSGSPFIGRSLWCRGVEGEIKPLAISGAPVFINGETGVGKELVARRIHELSPRSSGPFVAINCAAIPEDLLESELFGATDGAYTGARNRLGLVASADKGTLFLDEVGDLSLANQAKLLRFLEDGQVKRLGAIKSLKVDFRIVSATNKNLRAEVEAGRFRLDLYYRLVVLSLRIPPLRERPEDVMPIFERQLSEISCPEKAPVLSDCAAKRLVEYSWPGNVRELICVAKRVYHRSSLDTNTIYATNVEFDCHPPAYTTHCAAPDDITSDTPTIDELKRRYCEIVMLRSGGSASRASRVLGIDYKTLKRYLSKAG